MRPLLLALAWLGVAVLGVVAIRQRRGTERLRADWAALAGDDGSLALARSENARLRARAPSGAELERLRRAQAEFDALRARIGSDRARRPDGIYRTSDLPASDWKLAGRASPRDAFESALWAASHQDIDDLLPLLGFDARARAALNQVFDSLPEGARAQYGSPERVAALMVVANTPADLSGMDVLEARQDSGAANLLIRLNRSDGAAKDTFFTFQQTSEGWKLMVPASVVSLFSRQLGGGAPPSSP